jgi:hypothetical protein
VIHVVHRKQATSARIGPWLPAVVDRQSQADSNSFGLTWVLPSSTDQPVISFPTLPKMVECQMSSVTTRLHGTLSQNSIKVDEARCGVPCGTRNHFNWMKNLVAFTVYAV